MSKSATEGLDLAGAIARAAAALFGDTVGATVPTVERPRESGHGDYATNVAMQLAGKVGGSPREVADRLVGELGKNMEGLLGRAEVAGPGFINLFMSDRWFVAALQSVTASGASFGSGVVAEPEKINIEFVSANPTGPMHIGHGRHAAFGDALARIMEFAGHDVTREFYVNDYGGQVEHFGLSIAARMKGEDVPEDGYAGEYIDEVASKLGALGPGDAHALARAGVDLMLEAIRATLDRFNVRFDRWFPESELHSGGVEGALEKLEERGHTYTKEGALWLATEKFGDDKDRVLRRSTGESTYFAADIAYHEVKDQGGYDRLLNIWGADHHGYVKRMAAAYEALGGERERLEMLIVQLVQLVEQGQRAQMSKRKGEFVSLDELIDDIGVDAARFFLLNRRHDSAIDLDLDLARKHNQDNPVYYVQYAHARIAGILNKAADELGALPKLGAAIEVELHPSETNLIKKLLEFPQVVTLCCDQRDTHDMTAYLQALASDFSSFYRDCKVVGAESDDQTALRLELCHTTKSVLARALELLGISAPENM